MYIIRSLFNFLTFFIITRTRGICIVTWGFYGQTIHSRSYTYIIKNLYSNPSEVFDTIIKDEKIEKEKTIDTQCYDDLITTGHKYQLDKTKVDEYELKKKLWAKTLITVNILDNLRFYVSFIL